MSANFVCSCIFVIFLLTGMPCLVDTLKCHHKPVIITPENRIHMVRPNTQSRILAPDMRMKFQVDYHSSVMERPQAREIQSVVAGVVDRVSRTLSVKQEPGNFLFETNCEKHHRTVNINGQQYCTVGACYYSYCGEIMAPESLSEPCFDCNDAGENCTESGGPPVDREPVHYTLFVASLSASCEEDFIAYAYACRIDDTTDRPVAGVINICPNGFELGRERLLDTVQHEIFHALGFSSSMYGLYRDAKGKPLTPRAANGLPAQNPRTFEFVWSDRVIQNFNLDWEYINGTTRRSIQAFVMPNVLREARAHFGCPTLMGVELEDGGGFGTSMSHFEKRILATESMNGILTPVRVFSRISLALMEDTGWYIPDYGQADRLNWGKDLGCDFVLKSCKNWISTRINSGMSPAPWCRERFEPGCHAEGVNVGFCTLNKYNSPISEIFQLFTAINGVDPTELSRMGGNRLTDYCPFIEVDVRIAQDQFATDLYCTNLEIIDDCRISNCMNGGVCRDVISGYYCDCPVGYAGSLCDHVNVECTVNSDCQVNEVCTSNQCVCQRDRIRDQNDACIGLTDVKEYSMNITVTEVNGVPAVYQPSLMEAAGEGFRHDIEYEVHQIIGNDPTLRDAIVNVITRSVSSGSIIVHLGLIFRENSSDSSSSITLASVVAATVMQNNVLRESGMAYTVIPDATVVQDANECEDAAGNDCSPYARCINTNGSYECACLPGYEDNIQAGIVPGRDCTDVNECSTTLDNDCSPDANCLNEEGSYTCSCRIGYDDESLVDGRPGRVCIKQGVPSSVFIALYVGLGFVFSLFLLFMGIWCIIMRNKASRKAYKPGSSHHLPRHHTHDVVRSVKTMDHDFAHPYDVGSSKRHREPSPYLERDEPRPLPYSSYIEVKRSWYNSGNLRHVDSPFMSTGPGFYEVNV